MSVGTHGASASWLVTPQGKRKKLLRALNSQLVLKMPCFTPQTAPSCLLQRFQKFQIGLTPFSSAAENHFLNLSIVH